MSAYPKRKMKKILHYAKRVYLRLSVEIDLSSLKRLSFLEKNRGSKGKMNIEIIENIMNCSCFFLPPFHDFLLPFSSMRWVNLAGLSWVPCVMA